MIPIRTDDPLLIKYAKTTVSKPIWIKFKKDLIALDYLANKYSDYIIYKHNELIDNMIKESNESEIINVRDERFNITKSDNEIILKGYEEIIKDLHDKFYNHRIELIKKEYGIDGAGLLSPDNRSDKEFRTFLGIGNGLEYYVGQAPSTLRLYYAFAIHLWINGYFDTNTDKKVSDYYLWGQRKEFVDKLKGYIHYEKTPVGDNILTLNFNKPGVFFIRRKNGELHELEILTIDQRNKGIKGLYLNPFNGPSNDTIISDFIKEYDLTKVPDDILRNTVIGKECVYCFKKTTLFSLSTKEFICINCYQ